MSNRARLLRGSLVRVLHVVIGAVVSAALMRWMVDSLGTKAFGVWTAIAAFVGYFWFLDLGLGSGVTRFVSRSRAAGDDRSARVAASTAFVMLSVLGVAVAGALLLSEPLVGRVIPAAFRPELPRTLACFAIAFAVAFPAKALEGAIAARLRYDMIAAADVVRSLGLAVGLWFALHRGGRLESIAAAHAAAIGAATGVLMIGGRRERLLHLLNPVHADVGTAARLLRYSAWATVGQWGDLCRTKLPFLVLAGVVGAVGTATYAVAMRAIETLGQFVLNAVGVLVPLFSADDGRRDHRALRRHLILTSKISGVAAAALGTALIGFARPLVDFWMGSAYEGAVPALMLVAIAATADLMQVPAVNLFYGVSRHRFFVIGNLAVGLSVAGLTALAAPRYGVFGAAMSFAAPLFVFKTVVQPLYVCRIVRLPLRLYARPLFTLLLFPVTAAVLSTWRPVGAPARLTSVEWGGLIVAILLTGARIFSPHERALILMGEAR